MKRLALIPIAVLAAVSPILVAQDAPSDPADSQAASTNNPTPYEDSEQSRDCYECGGEGEYHSSVSGTESCPAGTAERKANSSVYYTLGLGTATYRKKNFVTQDPGPLH